MDLASVKAETDGCSDETARSSFCARSFIPFSGVTGPRPPSVAPSVLHPLSVVSSVAHYCVVVSCCYLGVEAES